MQRFLLIQLALLWACTFTQAEEPEVHFPERHFTFLEKYCLDCHDSLTEKGEVNLEDLPFHIETIEQAENWQKVLATLNSGEMPPRSTVV